MRPSRAGVLRIGYQKNGILVVAKQQRAIEAALEPLGHRVTWVEFSFGPPLLEALSLDGIDFGQTGDAPPIFAQAAKSTLVYAAAQEAGGSGSGILLPKGSTLKSLADLKGKRVAFAKASSAHNLTVAALEKAGLTYADIEPVTLAPADAAAAFSRGSIDAWTIWDPYYAHRRGGRRGPRARHRPGYRPTEQLLPRGTQPRGQRPAVLSAAVGALERVAAWCTQNRGEVAALLSQGTGVPLAATRERSTDRLRDRPDDPRGSPPRSRPSRTASTPSSSSPAPIVADAVWTAPARNG